MGTDQARLAVGLQQYVPVVRAGDSWRRVPLQDVVLRLGHWHPTKGVCMGYAENTGQFDAPGDFRVQRAGLEPLLAEWPNPDVVKIGNHYHSFADPIDPRRKFDHIKYPIRNRAICEAVSSDGLNWEIVGFIQPEDDAPATHIPQTLVMTIGGKRWLYLLYSTQRGGEPDYDYRYDRIRAMRREITP